MLSRIWGARFYKYIKACIYKLLQSRSKTGEHRKLTGEARRGESSRAWERMHTNAQLFVSYLKSFLPKHDCVSLYPSTQEAETDGSL